MFDNINRLMLYLRYERQKSQSKGVDRLKDKKEYILKILYNHNVGIKVYKEQTALHSFSSIKKLHDKLNYYKEKNYIEILNVEVYEKTIKYKLIEEE